MSLTYPLAMPPGASEQNFEVQRVDYLAPEAGGRLGGITAGFPLWKMTLVLGTLTLDQSDAWRALLAGMRGSQRIFTAWDIARMQPRAHPGGLPGGWSGDAASWSVSIDANGFAVLALEGVSAGTTVMPGDYVGFRWGTYQRALVRAIEPARASGGSIAFSVEPPPPTIIPDSAVASFANPVCLMKIVTSETQLGNVGRMGKLLSGTIVAVQDLIP